MGVSRSQSCIAEGGKNSLNPTPSMLANRGEYGKLAVDRNGTRVSPPASSPAEVVKISPENLEIANSYLACQSIEEVSRNLRLPTDEISSVLSKREVRSYIDNVFLDVGYNNRFKMRNIMDAVINKKLQEMDESDIGSQKDIVEILALSHKMSMDILDRQIKLEEAQAKHQNIRNQNNIQINSDGSTRYEQLIQELMKNK